MQQLPKKPTGPVDVVLDTDTYNEIDDQFALSYLLKWGDTLRLQAIYATPFYNTRSTSPEDGMEKSYDEILKLLHLAQREDVIPLVYKGSRDYLQDETTPQPSPAATDLVARALQYTPESPLYVIAIGAITNVASALLLKPEIKENIVLVWLGGNSLDWHDNREFNLCQDIAAARLVFGCGVPLVQLPCMGVVSSFSVSGPELMHHLAGKNPLCDYLATYTCAQALIDGGNACWSRVIWDVAAVAWLLPGEFMLDRPEPSPIPEYDHHYGCDKRRHFIRYVYHIQRDALLADLVQKLTQ